MSHAVDAVLKGAMALAAGAAGLEQLDEPATRLELARRLDEEAAAHERSAALLQALALGLRIAAEIDVDAGREPVTVEEEA
ncbi:MAG: hypothetical protein RLZZ631_1290 [Cyanobacteriota bacterium]|jgi:hypothetical protein